MRLTPFLLSSRKVITFALQSTASEVRRFGNFSERTWANFLVLTAAIARQHCKDKEDRIPLKWTDLSLHERKHLQSLVNSELDAQGEAPVDERILHWRMNKAFYNMIKTRKGIEARSSYKAKNIAAGHEADYEAHKTRVECFIRSEIRPYAAEHPNLTWKQIPYKDKVSLAQRVNEKLREEGIPEANDKYMEYQMENYLMSLKNRVSRQSGVSTGELLQSGEDEDVKGA